MIRLTVLSLVVALASACSAAPPESGLRDSFARQLEANSFVKDFQHSGDTMTFTAPRPDGASAMWRVQIDSASIEPQPNQAQPYKGTVRSSWYVDGQKIESRGPDSNLPIELTSNGLAQECWALWDAGTKQWGWE
jgi:hypothetical protein